MGKAKRIIMGRYKTFWESGQSQGSSGQSYKRNIGKVGEPYGHVSESSGQVANPMGMGMGKSVKVQPSLQHSLWDSLGVGIFSCPFPGDL